MNKILIAGGTGFIGSKLTDNLRSKGYKINVLSRGKHRSNEENLEYFIWDFKNNFIDPNAFKGVSTIINLSGANIGSKRWTDKRKSIIMRSRIQSTELLYDTVKNNNFNIDSYISASAVGYYGSITTDNIFTEKDISGNDFLAEVTQVWEEKANHFIDLGIRTVLVRTGVVFDNKEGALTKIVQPIKYGFGAILGTGKQIIPWVHIDDIINAYVFMIENKVQGAYNVVAPNPIDNKNLTYLIAKTLKKPIWLPKIPKFVLKMILGEQANLVLEGSAASAQKIMDAGFHFKYTQPEKAIKDLLL